MKRMLILLLFVLLLTTAALAETGARTPLYFNPDGGSFYHTKENCESVSDKHLPLSLIPDADLTVEPYQLLTACPACAVPDALYFNPNGGSHYHADAHCESVSEKYLPLSPIPDADLTAAPYQLLTACPACIAEITE